MDIFIIELFGFWQEQQNMHVIKINTFTLIEPKIALAYLASFTSQITEVFLYLCKEIHLKSISRGVMKSFGLKRFHMKTPGNDSLPIRKLQSLLRWTRKLNRRKYKKYHN